MKYFGRASHLKTHTDSVHLGIKTAGCSQCGKSFTDKKNLRMHIKIHHTNEKPHQCSACNKAFADLHMMEKHEQIYSEVKQYHCEKHDKFTCESCQKGLVKNAFLKRHYEQFTSCKSNLDKFKITE